MSNKWQLLRVRSINPNICRVFDRDKNRIFIIFFWLLLFCFWLWLQPTPVYKFSVQEAPSASMPVFAPALERQLFQFYPSYGEVPFIPPNAEEYLQSALQVIDQGGVNVDEGGTVVRQIFEGSVGKYLDVLLRCYNAYKLAERVWVDSLAVSIEQPLPDLDLAPLQRRYFGEPLAGKIFPLDWANSSSEAHPVDPFIHLFSSPGCADFSEDFSNGRQ